MGTVRKSNEKGVDSGIYARVRAVQMSPSDRQHAIEALRQAEEITDAIIWVKHKLASIGHIFLKPSLKH
jgi:hypothetical protein